MAKKQAFWLLTDLETTGLHPLSEDILEICIVALNEQLEPVDMFHELVYWHGRKADCDPFVQQMHTDNGLWAELEGLDPEVSCLAMVKGRLMDWLAEFEAPKKLRLAGNSVHFDRSFLEAHVPAFVQAISHRQYDIGMTAEVLRGWGIDVPKAPPPQHRAEADCHDELQTWLATREETTAMVEIATLAAGG